MSKSIHSDSRSAASSYICCGRYVRIYKYNQLLHELFICPCRRNSVACFCLAVNDGWVHRFCSKTRKSMSSFSFRLNKGILRNHRFAIDFQFIAFYCSFFHWQPQVLIILPNSLEPFDGSTQITRQFACVPVFEAVVHFECRLQHKTIQILDGHELDVQVLIGLLQLQCTLVE